MRANVHIHIPPSYPPESLVLFVLSVCNVLVALFISRAGVLRREAIRAQGEMSVEASSISAKSA